ncbi:MAG: glycine--tRNA ligase subunit beta [Elusimicrobiota bacterium]|jgi:glycyl-tRNA synthetase beta chain|nr:glycine--tRNA ligase subunit beta [Elusimicrobiota bacterium]
MKKKSVKISKNTALLEIGVEEIPFSYIEPALKQIESFTLERLSEIGLNYSKLETFATPRRFVLVIKDMSTQSEEKLEEISGPPLKAAKNENGQWMQSAIGFASKNKTFPDKLAVKKTEKGEYLFFAKKIKGEKTEKILLSLFPEIIRNISFPKNMVWEQSGFKFARPIRNIAALYGAKIIKFQIADVVSSNWTIGLHTYDNSKIKVETPDKYFSKMKNRYVIIDNNERKLVLKKSIVDVVNKIGHVIEDDSLLNEVNYLLEYPSAVLCKFDKKYLELPKEVLTVCMKKSQKCFAVCDKKKQFTNYFINVKNGPAKHIDIAREGYERVVGARLADANFFYSNDIKKGLESNIEKLKGIIFHKDIGTVYEKVERIFQTALSINSNFCLSIDEKLLEKTVMLSKADLPCEMVFEYPELQGTMGKIYALKSGQPKELADAIQEHYYPLFAGGKLPKNSLALIISLADKLDSLAANFAIGLEPSGSADPYGLRRSAIGIVRMLVEVFPKSNFSGIIDKSFEVLPEKIKENQNFKSAKDKLLNFLWQRIENTFDGQYQKSEIKSVVGAAKLAGFKELGALSEKLKFLKAAKEKGDFTQIAESFKRINNILSKAKKDNADISQDVRQDLFSQNEEKNLFASLQSTKNEIESFIINNEYNKILEKVLEISPVINDFFEKVLVMDKDENLKKNKIALLSQVKKLFELFLDFSEL